MFPETSDKKILPGNYIIEEYYRKQIGKKGKTRINLHLYAIDDNGKKIGLRNVYSAYGKMIEQEIAEIDFENTIALAYCTLQVFPYGAREFRIVDKNNIVEPTDTTCPETSEQKYQKF